MILNETGGTIKSPDKEKPKIRQVHDKILPHFFNEESTMIYFKLFHRIEKEEILLSFFSCKVSVTLIPKIDKDIIRTKIKFWSNIPDGHRHKIPQQCTSKQILWTH